MNAPTIPAGFSIRETGGGEIVIEAPSGTSITLPNSEDGSKGTRLLRELARALMVTGAPSNASTYPASLVQRLRSRGEHEANEAADAIEQQQAALRMLSACVDRAAVAPADVWSEYVAGMIGAYLQWPLDDPRIKAVAGIIDRRKRQNIFNSNGFDWKPSRDLQ